MRRGIEMTMWGSMLFLLSFAGMNGPDGSVLRHFFDGAIGIGFSTCALIVMGIGLVLYAVERTSE